MIPVGISNRHVHLSAEDVQRLFGPGYQLNKMKDLKQKGQFAAKECVTLAGPKGSISFVRVLGPEREQTQVEISKTDSFALGIKVPVRESGDLTGSGSLCLLGPAGHVYLDAQVICAQRHIHMDSRDAKLLKVENGQKVSVKGCGERGLVFDEVVVRVKDSFVLEFHIDIDEANAAGLTNNDKVVIVDRY
ncbi:MAG: phosphate propanoyltransferase [Enterobacteriaceae bacterium]